MDSLFFYGSLRHKPLLDLVLGEAREVQVTPARLPGHAVYRVRGEPFPLIVEEPGAVAQGVHVSGLGETGIARLDFYEGGFGFALRPVTVQTAEGPRGAMVYFPDAGRWPVAELWSLDEWERDWAALSLRAAIEAMEQFGRIEPEELARWLPLMRVRAASWLRARREVTPMRIRHGLGEADVELTARARPYAKFFGLEEQKLRFRRFDGAMSETVARAALVSGDAVTVLPYDPVRDRVLLIEQFRFGPWVRGDRHPWCLEPIAGRIDPGETPEACAAREAEEEASISFRRLERIAAYYPTTGAMTEYIISFIGIADLPDSAGGLSGAAAEHEDIRSLVLPWEEFEAFLQGPEAENGPLILSGLWLAAHRALLRGDA